MRYRLGDICTIAKGATGIMKAVPGPFPMVTLAEERKQHDEYQFDAAAVIVPLISSTGHGHASIKRIHYQEGKFALGTILCAVIPKDETVLNARYLFVYLQQFKDSVLVPLMKGAANVSLPLNKLAALEVEVPTLAKQQEVIDLAAVLTGHKNDLEILLDAQEADTVKLRQALLREAMQGQLLPQDPTDEPAAVLLQQLQAAKSGKKGRSQAGSLYTEEAEAVEGPFAIPASWEWCKLGDLCFVTKLAGFEYTNHFKLSPQGDVPVVRAQNVKPNRLIEENLLYLDEKTSLLLDRSALKGPSLLITFIGAGIGEVAIFNKKERWHLAPNVAKAEVYLEDLSLKYLMWYLLSNYGVAEFFKITKATSQPSLSMGTIREVNVPLPPLAEQHRIVAKLEQLLQHCDALEQRIRESRRLAEQLLATALREALAPPAGATLPEAAELELAEAEAPAPHGRRITAGKQHKVPASLGPLFD